MCHVLPSCPGNRVPAHRGSERFAYLSEATQPDPAERDESRVRRTPTHKAIPPGLIVMVAMGPVGVSRTQTVGPRSPPEHPGRRPALGGLLRFRRGCPR